MSRSTDAKPGLQRALPLAAVEPDGLTVTTAGTYVRTLTIDTPAQPLTAGREGRRRHRQRMAAIAARLKPHQSLQITVQSDPIPVDDVIAHSNDDVQRAARAAEQRGEADLAVAMRRMHAGEAQTLRRFARASAAQQLAYYVTVPWRPAVPWLRPGAGARPRYERRPQTVSYSDHQRAAEDSLREVSGVAADLQTMGPRLLDGNATLGLLRSRLAPGPVAWDRLVDVPALIDADTPQLAAARRTELLHALAGDIELGYRRSDVVHGDGTLERVLRLETIPDATSAWWLMPLLEIHLPYRLVVHIHATDRARERFAQRTRRRRLRATTRSKWRRGEDVTPEHEEAEAEAIALDAELRSSGRAGIYDVSCYLTILEPTGDADRLDQVTSTVTREFLSVTDAQFRPAGGLTRAAWASTLSTGIDRLHCTRRYSSRNIGDLLPLVGSRCGTPDGVPLGFAAPGRTLEHLDPYDPTFRTAVGTVTGLSGRGKTLAVARLAKMWLSRDAHVRIIDRSSTEDQAAGAESRGMGHYEPLASLVPGARIVRMGARGGPVICPWDVHDPGNVPATKLSFLKALHALLIGQRAAGTQDRVLTAAEESLLDRAIEATYQHAAVTQGRPCEQLLIDTMLELAAEAAQGENKEAAGTYRMLAERLRPYGEGGTYSHLTHDPTTVEAEAPLVIYDLGGVPVGLSGPIALTIAEREERLIGARRGRLLRGELPAGGSWTGRTAMIVDETWAQMAHDVAGAWLNEWARRVRHIATALVAITQHLSDFRNEQGRALLRQSAWHLVFGADDDELAGVREDLGLSAEEAEIIGDLVTRPGEYSTAYLVSPRGRGTVRISLADLEYWMCSADPRRDQPLRAAALRQTDGDPWAALRLLCDPDWHASQHRTLIGA